MNIVVLGATGSVGAQALAVARRRGHRVLGVSARRASPRLIEIVAEFAPEAVACAEPLDLPRGVALLPGPDALAELAAWPGVDVVVVAVSGFAGLAPILRAVGMGRRAAVATKEAIISGGALLTDAVAAGLVLPVDSEHAAAFQLLRGRDRAAVRRVVLTASGGALRDWPSERLAQAAPEDALRHPNWRMGDRITVDTATLLNKGVELIEARVLFGYDYDQLDIWIHPQSIVHALVEMRDGATYAALARPDMALPIEQALAHPGTAEGALAGLSVEEVAQLTFSRPDPERYPALKVCEAAGTIGGTMPTVLCAANELAVAAFLQGRIPFTAIIPLVAAVMDRHAPQSVPDLPALVQSDRWARETASELLRGGAFA